MLVNGYNGAWRSLVACHLGVMEVVGSDPAAPKENGKIVTCLIEQRISVNFRSRWEESEQLDSKQEREIHGYIITFQSGLFDHIHI
jgi:hypothetical protein